MRIAPHSPTLTAATPLNPQEEKTARKGAASSSLRQVTPQKEIAFKTASGGTITPAQAKAHVAKVGAAQALKDAKSPGVALSNAQIASLLGIQTKEVDAFERSLGATHKPSNASSANNNSSVTTPTGHRVSPQEGKVYAAAYGYQAAYAKGKSLNMSHAQMAQLLDMDVAAVDAFAFALRQSAQKPSDDVYALDLSRPSTEAQAYAQQLWTKPFNASISDAQLQQLARDAIGQLPPEQVGMTMVGILLNMEVPVPQFVSAVKDLGIDAFSQENTEKFLASIGLPSPGIWRESVDQSTAAHVRLFLDQNGLSGLNGQGVGVWVVEPTAGLHAEAVASVIADEKLGMAPGAKVSLVLTGPSGADLTQFLGERFSYEVARLTLAPDEPGPQLDERSLLKQAFGNAISGVFADVFHRQKELVDDFAQSDARVMNHSSGLSFADMAEPMLNVALAIVQDNPQLSRALVAEAGGPSQFYQGVIDFAAASMAVNPELRFAHAAYVDSTRQASEAGKVIVYPAGNEQPIVRAFEKELKVTLPAQLAGFNAWGMTDHVITVGASSTQGTPMNVADDIMAASSSHSGERYGVTLTTQGQNVAVPYPVYLELRGQSHGTSLSAPAVAATAALLIQANPDISFEGVKAWLQAHAIDTMAPRQAEGAGMLDLPGAAAQAVA